jgi:hypothetical protein
MRIRTFWVAIFGYVVLGHALPAVAQVDQQRAQAYFKEVQALCERDGGRLWGVSLCGPMVIGDIRMQTFATSQPAPEVPRPRLVGLVNAPVEWGSATWGAYVWDFVVNATPRGRKGLFLHELFHVRNGRFSRSVVAPIALPSCSFAFRPVVGMRPNAARSSNRDAANVHSSPATYSATALISSSVRRPATRRMTRARSLLRVPLLKSMSCCTVYA